MTLLDHADAARSFPGYAQQDVAISGRTLRQRTARPPSEKGLNTVSKTTSKRALVAPQAVAATAAIDNTAFGEAHAALLKATADLHAFTFDYEEDTPVFSAKRERLVREANEALDRTLGQPTSDPLQIAAKVALLWRVAENVEVDPSDPEAAKYYIANGTDADHAVLAIYHDLLAAAVAPRDDQQALPWDQAWSLMQTYQGRYDAWEAEAGEDDDRRFPDELHRLGGAARKAMLAARAPHWGAVAEKARLLEQYDYIPDEDDEPLPPEGKGFSYWLQRTIAFLSKLGATPPEAITYLDALEATACIERLIHEAATSEDGYREFACQPDAIAQVAEVLDVLLQDARDISAKGPAPYARADCLNVIVFPQSMIDRFNPERFVLLLVACRLSVMAGQGEPQLMIKARGQHELEMQHPLADGLKWVWDNLSDEQRQSVSDYIRAQR